MWAVLHFYIPLVKWEKKLMQRTLCVVSPSPPPCPTTKTPCHLNWRELCRAQPFLGFRSTQTKRIFLIVSFCSRKLCTWYSMPAFTWELSSTLLESHQCYLHPVLSQYPSSNQRRSCWCRPTIGRQALISSTVSTAEHHSLITYQHDWTRQRRKGTRKGRRQASP